jgi:hypothetical protein
MVKSLFIIALLASVAAGQAYIQDVKRESARSDKITGGITRAAFVPGDPNIRLTLNIPSFQFDRLAERNGSGDVSRRRRQDRLPRSGQSSQRDVDRVQPGLDPAVERLDREVEHGKSG